MHNQGHNIIAFSHDPDQRHLEDYAVMGDVTTAMRDPIFYRWHSFIESVFVRYKNTLPSYNVAQHFAYNGVTVDSINVQITRGKNPSANTLLTFWQKSDVDLAAGLDFGPKGNVYAEFTHLQHAPFEYIISVTNSGYILIKFIVIIYVKTTIIFLNSAARRGTCRIFMCPRFDERGTPLRFRDQRSLMIEMDKFTVNCKVILIYDLHITYFFSNPH